MAYRGRAFRAFGLRTGRATALALSALLVLAGLLDVAPGHRCPHHEALPVGHGDAASHPAGHAETGGSRWAGAAPADAPHNGPCTCVDSCPAGVGQPLPVAADARPTAPAPQASALRPRDAGRNPARLVPYLLPYAIAPPSIG